MPTNIVLIVIDDLGWMDLGCYGSTFYETPQLDRLAASGIRFTNAYAACPVCSPTRAAILSGKYPARVGITNWIGADDCGSLASVPYLHYLPREEHSLARALQESGYQTWHVGKWHLGDEGFLPQDHGFEVNIAGGEWGRPPHGYFAPWHLPFCDDSAVPDGTYLTDHLTDCCLDLLRTRDLARPFFLHLNHYAVHTPIEAPAELVEKYRAKAAALGLDRLEAIQAGEYFPSQRKRHQRVQRRLLQSDPVYAAMLENLDSNIGRLLAALDDLQLSQDTLVFFTSDNGGLATAEGSPTCNLPLREGKGWAMEGGTRVCQLARWPGRIRPGSISTCPVTSTDFYPSCLHAADLPLRPAQHVDGLSLLPVLCEEVARLPRQAIFWHYPHYGNQGGTPYCAAVSGCGRWKLIEDFEKQAVVLYDLQQDPGELRPCGEAHPQRCAAMLAQLRAWQHEVAAQIPQPNPAWQPARPQSPNNAYE